MRFLADENFPGVAYRRLSELGHDVAWVELDAAGSADDEVLQRSRAEDRVLLTFDKDFGDLVFARGRDGSAGVVLFRLSMESPEQACRLLVEILESRDDWAGNFSVVDERRVRIRPLG